LAELERDHPDTQAPFVDDDDTEIALSVSLMRQQSYCIEAEVMARCYEDWNAARELVERAIVIDPALSNLHALCASFCAEAGDYAGAVTAMERAVSLEPGNLMFKQVLNDFRREAERRKVAEAAASKPSLWNVKSWLK
jgi:tetratricopeptide (TPR) repeat protein